MNVRSLIFVPLLLVALLPALPAASACESNTEPLKSICNGQVPPLPCLSVNCAIAEVHYVVDPAEHCAIAIATYDWFDWDPAHDPVPQFSCYDLTN